MSLIAAFQDGKFVDSTSATSLSEKKETNSSGIDSESFLTLLVAEMQNQDPLEPTSNTEWISQYATFTQVSEIQEIGTAMDSVKAQDLVGQYVIMKVTSEATGDTNYVSGQVDYVVYEEGKAFLSIGNELYSIDDLDTVASEEYMEAYDLAKEVEAAYKKLPKLDDLTLSYADEVEELTGICDKMTDYQKTFFEKSFFETLDEYSDKIASLRKAQEEAEEPKGEETDTDSESKEENVETE